MARKGGFSAARGGGSNQQPKISGRQLRKDRRKEERAASKKRAIPLVPNFEGHDSDVRSIRRRVELFVESTKRTIAKEEERLRAWTSPKTEDQLEAEKLKKKGSGLRGAAKPAWERYPELYPEMHKEEPPESTFDLISQHSPNCFGHPETRTLVGLYFQLGHAWLADDKSKLKGKEAQLAFKRCLELEKSDPFGSRYGFLIASLERGALVDEWEEILSSDFLQGTAEALYTRGLALFLSSVADGDERQNQDETQQALNAAVASCPEIALALLNQELMTIVVDPGLVLERIRERRERLVLNATTEGLSECRSAGLCDVKTCSSPEALAVCYYVCFGQYWTEKPLLDALAQALATVEVEEKALTVDQEEDVEDESSEEWFDRGLRRMYEEVALKF